MKPRVLIVEDVFIEAHSLERTLLAEGYPLYPVADTVEEALAVIERVPVDLVLLDIHLKGDRTGIHLAHILNEKNIAFIYLSANSNRAVLEEAKLTRPYGFLVKPFRKKDLLIALDIAAYLHRYKHLRQSEAARPRPQQPGDQTPPPRPLTAPAIIGNSPAITTLMEQTRIAAGSNVSVLILGETGTGKELVAREIHRLSDRRNKPFIIVNCGGIPPTLVEAELFGHEKGAFTGAQSRRPGKFELADGGTIFLDEIGELPIDMQPKFLRVLQEGEVEPIGGLLKHVNVRVLAATNRNLEAEIANNRFRLDLYYRLSVFPILLPPLRNRRQDIPLLAMHFMKRFGQESGKLMTDISAAAIQQLQQYAWPGNIRELENVIHRSLLNNPGPVMENICLPTSSPAGPAAAGSNPEDLSIAGNERNHILKILDRCNWKVAGKDGAASVLNIKVSTLTSRMKKLGITRPK
ncbi:MAG TPA: sigma-54 dependent transcriptional regulator [Puia sp.]|uniref:sigma-54-dependent transcriptional regulator n=1 Tax=Puia sp. TaxID=2045100 RepID=UPI002BEFE810|nr:sigma-54 dependent transcriptional regulator [Puia sp.]HVU98484.1 sigma-54 dependent transcriptional regulator [Puia sp.]